MLAIGVRATALKNALSLKRAMTKGDMTVDKDTLVNTGIIASLAIQRTGNLAVLETKSPTVRTGPTVRTNPTTGTGPTVNIGMTAARDMTPKIGATDLKVARLAKAVGKAEKTTKANLLAGPTVRTAEAVVLIKKTKMSTKGLTLKMPDKGNRVVTALSKLDSCTLK